MKIRHSVAATFLALIVVFLTLRASVLAQPSRPDAAPANALSAEDDSAIRKTVAGIEAAWNAHDMDAYGKLLHEDVQWINVVGMHWHGHKEVMAAHIAFHKTTFKNHSLKTDRVEVRSLGGGHAIAVVTTTNDAFTTPAGDVRPKAQDRQTYVMVKDADGWKIAHGHNVVVDAEVAKHNPVKKPKT
jgi:uncharacterized protein (TIGR02246 family)